MSDPAALRGSISVAEKTEQPPAGQPIRLKDPAIAGLLAWLLPGLGHLYQGRWAKAALYLVSILGMFLWGLYLSSSPGTGPARAVYLSFRTGDVRLYYLGQVGIGLPALPAVLQAVLVSNGIKPLCSGFMAPPALDARPGDEPGSRPPALCTLDDLSYCNHYFEFGTVYTLIAGLLNILAVYDACCGPAPSESPKKKDEEDAQSAVGH